MMNNEQFLQAIEGDTIQPPQTVFNLTDVAVGLRLPHAPQREALQRLRNLLVQPEDEPSVDVQEFCIWLTDQPPQRVGQIALTLENYTRIMQLFRSVEGTLCYVQGQEWSQPIPPERLIHTIQLKGLSIYEHI